MERQGIDIILWIKPFFHPSLKKRKNKLTNLFWKELFSHLNETERKFLYPKTTDRYKKSKPGQYIILKTKPSSVSLDDFSRINAIMKTPLLFSEKKKIAQLKLLRE